MDIASGFVGCIRRLEINNKIYNFEPAERQGDVLFGIDIGEFVCAFAQCIRWGITKPIARKFVTLMLLD